MYLLKNKSGLYSPMDDSDFEESKKIKAGTVVKATAPRNYQFLKKIFALFNLGFSSQDKIESFEAYRKILILKAGYYHEVPNKYGELYYIPQSLSYESMSEETFNKVYDDVLMVLSKEMETAPAKIKKELESFF